MSDGISTHVLDTATGRPVAGVPVSLARLQPGTGGDEAAWTPVGSGTTDADGRIGALLPDSSALVTGRYRVRFDLEAAGTFGWYPEVAIVVDLDAGGGHSHIPLLLAPYSYTTYRGS